MKQVVTNPPAEFVAIQNVSYAKSYGTVYSSEKKKAFLLAKEYFHGDYHPSQRGIKFYWLCANCMTKCNRLGNENGYSSFEEAIQAMLNAEREVYEFDSDKELLKWLAAD
jgi:hypothetical protein